MFPATLAATLVLAAMDLAEAAFKSPALSQAVTDARRTYEDMRREMTEAAQQGRQLTPEEYQYWIDIVDRQIDRQQKTMKGYYRE